MTVHWFRSFFDITLKCKTWEWILLTFILLPSWRYCAIDLAIVSKKNHEYCNTRQKETGFNNNNNTDELHKCVQYTHTKVILRIHITIQKTEVSKNSNIEQFKMSKIFKLTFFVLFKIKYYILIHIYIEFIPVMPKLIFISECF